jgi:opacity protein-like surface antigen
MKKFTLSLVTVLAMSTFAIAGGDIAPVEEPIVEVAPVVDDSGFYVGIGYSYINLNDKYTPIGTISGNEMDYYGNALTVLAGYNFNKYIALEGRYSVVLGDLTWEDDDLGEDFDGELSNIGLYLKPMYPIGGLTLYGLLGYGQVTLDFSPNGDSEHSESGFQWGLGASYAVNDNVGVFVDYTRLYDDKGFDNGFNPNSDIIVDSINVGLTYKF